MKRLHYIDLMEKTLAAYSISHIECYYNKVKANGLTEHGFPRLTANIGILLAHGRRSDLRKCFVKMMDLCCEEIPRRKQAGNEFSIKEVIFALMELEKHSTFARQQLELWKDQLKKVTVENCYNIYAVAPDSAVHNWAAFAMVSEWMRYYIGAAACDWEFIDNQAASQWQWVDENGMYLDDIYGPSVYDIAPRGLFAILLHFGYRGKYFRQWDDALRRAGTATLKMLSVTGEIPYGGRSNQFVFNEAACAVVLEYEASRYARIGDMRMAARFKSAVARCLGNVALWLEREVVTHIKNFFPRESGYGCEPYAYFDKYMITTASFLYSAYLLSDDTIPDSSEDESDTQQIEIWQSSDRFHRIFLRAGEYFAQYDYRAQWHYDSSGLGRLHRKGAPSALCLSVPGTGTPDYKIGDIKAVCFAIVPEIFCNGLWSSCAVPEVLHAVDEVDSDKAGAWFRIICTLGSVQVGCKYVLTKEGMEITVEGGTRSGLMLPAFEFDGRAEPRIVNRGKSLEIFWQNWKCVYETFDGIICDTGRRSCNKNGHYKLFRAEGGERLTVKITLEPAAP